MPYSKSPSPWATDPGLFEALDGGPDVISWFGFLPDFHDATVRRIEFSGGCGVVEIDAFRMTSKVDEKGYFILDKHALVCLHLCGVTGIVMECDPNPGIDDLGIRKITADDIPSGLAAQPGDFEIGFDDVCAGAGSIFARSIRLTVTPTLASGSP